MPAARPLAGWCHVGSGLAVAGRAGQGLWWALDPRPDLSINILGCRRLCLLGPSPGAAAAGQVLGAGVTRPQHSHFLLARQAAASLPPFWVGARW